MVLIIRNNRLLSSRQSRIKHFLDYMQTKQYRASHKETVTVQTDRETNTNKMGFVKVLCTLFLYSLAMFTLPFVVFFSVRHLLTSQFHLETFTINCISVMSAVVTVNLIIAGYAYQAFHEQDDTGEDSKETSDPTSKESLNKKVN